MDINTTLVYLFPNEDQYTAWKIYQKDGVQSIIEWNIADPQPTQAELDAAWPAAETDKATKKAAKDAEKADVTVRAKQKLGFTDEEYDTWVDTL